MRGLAKSPTDLGEHVVLLADRKLLELPLEALSVLQEESLLSVSRDFSLQLLCSRLKTDIQKPEKGTRHTHADLDASRYVILRFYFQFYAVW